MYDENSIQRLDPMEHVRRRVKMYIGSIDQRGMHTLLYEVISSSLDDALAQECDRIEITLSNDNYVKISDNGKGLEPKSRNNEMSILEHEITYLSRYKSLGHYVTPRIAVSIVNALSNYFLAEVKHDGYLWRQEYRQGNKITEVTQVRALATDEGTGTTITFTPDFTILEQNNFDYPTIAKRLRELAFVISALTMTLHDERSKQQETFYAPNGLRDFVAYINADHETLYDIIHGSREVQVKRNNNYHQNVKVEFAMQYSDSEDNRELGFANTTATPQGTHLTGFRRGLTRSINQFARKTGALTEKDNNFTRKEVARGLTAVVSIYHPSPSFENQTRFRLINPELPAAVARVVSAEMAAFGEQHPEAMQRIVQKCLQSRTEISGG